jgi:hypothetical protein
MAANNITGQHIYILRLSQYIAISVVYFLKNLANKLLPLLVLRTWNLLINGCDELTSKHGEKQDHL